MGLFFLSALLLAVLAAMVSSTDNQVLYICESEDPVFLGAYSIGGSNVDDAPVYSNQHDMSFYRNKGFWYLGNLGPWPPETHYRCVEPEGCNYMSNVPPTSSEGAWKGSKRFNRDVAPLISKEPCASKSEEL